MYCHISDTRWQQHGRKSRGNTGEESSRIWSWDANTNCPLDFVMFHNFKHQIACITNTIRCSKRLTNSMTLTENSIISKSTSSASTKNHFRRKFNTFLARTRTKNRSECTKCTIFSGEGSAYFTDPFSGEESYSFPIPNPSSPSSLPDLHLRPQNSSQIYATGQE